MNTLKNFGKYILCIILFYIFSHILIFIGIANTYKSIELKKAAPNGITIDYAKAARVHGKIDGKISSEIDSPYIKFNFYNKMGNLSDSYYLNTSEVENGNFEFYFKLNNIKSYDIEFSEDAPKIANSENFSLEKFSTAVVLSAFFYALFV